MGQLEAPGKMKDVRRDLARVKTVLARREGEVVMAAKAQNSQGVVVSDKMEKSVVVAVERQVRTRCTARSSADVEVPGARRGERGEGRATASPSPRPGR
jgi:hypothetical protein